MVVSLTRYFSILGLTAIMLATGGLIYFYSYVATAHLIQLTEDENARLTKSLSNAIWPEFGTYISGSKISNGNALRSQPETDQLNAAISYAVKDLNVLKVKIYNIQGVTIFSSEYSQIGESKFESKGFNLAIDTGRPVSKISKRDKFSAFSKEVFDRDVVESYVLVRNASGTAEAVFEVYRDVTAQVKSIIDVRGKLFVGLLAIFGIQYLFLYLYVRKVRALIDKSKT